MSKRVIWFRTFNAIIERFVSVWSIGIIVVPGILSLLITGFFALPALPTVTLLIAACCVVGAIALIWGISTGYWRYQYLTDRANELLNKYDFDIPEKIPDEISLNEVIFVHGQNQTVAYFKRYVRSSFIPIEVNLTPQESEVIQQEKKALEANPQKPRSSAINTIIQRVLSEEGSFFNSPQILQSKKEFTPAQQRMRTWEKINAFLSDATTAFAFVAIIIFLVSHVFFGTLIPGYLLIAVAVSVLYGVLSAYMKDNQVESRLDAMVTFSNRSKAVKQEAEALRVEINICNSKLNYLTEKFSSKIEQDEQLKTKISEAQTSMREHTEKLQLLPTQLSKIYQYQGFTNKDIFRVIYALFYGEIVAGALIYIALPLLMSAFGLAPFSLPVLVGIAAAVGLIYGIYNMYHKMKVIEQEKWANTDDKNVKAIKDSLKTVNKKGLKQAFEQVQEAEKSLAKVEEELKPPVPADNPETSHFYRSYIEPIQQNIATAEKSFIRFFKEGSDDIEESTTSSSTPTPTSSPPPGSPKLVLHDDDE